MLPAVYTCKFSSHSQDDLASLYCQRKSPAPNPSHQTSISWKHLRWIPTIFSPPPPIPQRTMPCYWKRAALAMTISGFILALEIKCTTQNLKLNYCSNLFKFSHLLGYFPMNCLLPSLNFSARQKSASSLLI